jgi:hypothetical protein
LAASSVAYKKLLIRKNYASHYHSEDNYFRGWLVNQHFIVETTTGALVWNTTNSFILLLLRNVWRFMRWAVSRYRIDSTLRNFILTTTQEDSGYHSRRRVVIPWWLS